jgi:hypothetical protein
MEDGDHAVMISWGFLTPSKSKRALFASIGV